MDGRLPRVRAAAMMLWAALAAAPGPAVALLTPDLRLCDGGATTGTCYQSLARSLSVRPPLLGTAYFSGVCTLGYPCLPTDHPIADWVTVTVLNGGTAQAVAMTVGLYISDELVTLSNGALGCHVDVTFPAANATSVGTGSVGPLQVGALPHYAGCMWAHCRIRPWACASVPRRCAGRRARVRRLRARFRRHVVGGGRCGAARRPHGDDAVPHCVRG